MFFFLNQANVLNITVASVPLMCPIFFSVKSKILKLYSTHILQKLVIRLKT